MPVVKTPLARYNDLENQQWRDCLFACNDLTQFEAYYQANHMFHNNFPDMKILEQDYNDQWQKICNHLKKEYPNEWQAKDEAISSIDDNSHEQYYRFHTVLAVFNLLSQDKLSEQQQAWLDQNTFKTIWKSDIESQNFSIEDKIYLLNQLDIALKKHNKNDTLEYTKELRNEFEAQLGQEQKAKYKFYALTTSAAVFAGLAGAFTMSLVIKPFSQICINAMHRTGLNKIADNFKIFASMAIGVSAISAIICGSFAKQAYSKRQTLPPLHTEGKEEQANNPNYQHL